MLIIRKTKKRMHNRGRRRKKAIWRGNVKEGRERSSKKERKGRMLEKGTERREWIGDKGG
jgi:hypothetical protein